MTPTTQSRRYIVLGSEHRQGKQVVKVLNRVSDETFFIYMRGRRWCFFATDQPVRDATLRKHARLLLDAEKRAA